MKIAYGYGTSETEAPIMGIKGPEHEVFPKLKTMGYDGVELWVRNPRNLDKGALAKRLRQYGLEVAAVGTGPAASEDGLTLTAADDEARSAAVERLKEIVEFASLFGCPVLVGKARGEVNPQSPHRSLGWMAEGLDSICRHAEKHGISICLEPQNRKAINNLNTASDTLRFIASLRLPNLCLMLDLYHMHAENEPFRETFIHAQDRLRYLHVADSTRGSPGTGMFDFAEIIRSLREIGYSGYLSFEINQGTDGFREARTAIGQIRSVL